MDMFGFPWFGAIFDGGKQMAHYVRAVCECGTGGNGDILSTCRVNENKSSRLGP